LLVNNGLLVYNTKEVPITIKLLPLDEEELWLKMESKASSCLETVARLHSLIWRTNGTGDVEVLNDTELKSSTIMEKQKKLMNEWL
jgi:hypothetical protein